MIDRSEAGKRLSLSDGTAGTVEYTFTEHGGTVYYSVKRDVLGEYGVSVDLVKPADAVELKPEPEPKSIRFEKVRCGRCKGLGRRNDNGWGANHEGICYRCHGEGMALTSNGYRAQEAYYKMRDEALTVHHSELPEGAAYWYSGKCYAKGGYEPKFHFDAKVRRHDGPAVREMWKTIAARYKGATLVY